MELYILYRIYRDSTKNRCRIYRSLPKKTVGLGWFRNKPLPEATTGYFCKLGVPFVGVLTARADYVGTRLGPLIFGSFQLSPGD